MNLRLAASASIAAVCLRAAAGADIGVEQLNRKGNIHIPIGIANSVDTLDMSVEAEGCFSPVAGS